MKTIGKLLKEARLKKRYSVKRVESETRIKREFIEAVEKENWDALPDFTVVNGFVKNLAAFLGLSKRTAIALLRRDYPPRTLSINPKPDVGDTFVWSPRLTFLVGIAMVTLVILGYLGFQYAAFTGPPTLSLTSPKEGEVITQRLLMVSGTTDTDAIISVNNQPALVDADGKFSTTLEISKETKEIEIKATSRSGRETVVRRKINPEFK